MSGFLNVIGIHSTVVSILTESIPYFRPITNAFKVE